MGWLEDVQGALNHGVQQAISLPGQVIGAGAQGAMAVSGVVLGQLEQAAMTTGLIPCPPPAKDTFSQVKGVEKSKRVFVIHGRDRDAYIAIRDYLSALGLAPYDYDDELLRTTKAAPYVGDIVKQAVEKAAAIVVLFTPEEHAQLDRRFRADRDRYEPANVERFQARPNVIFEAGLAFGANPDRTVFVALGPEVQVFSDIHGVVVHYIKRGDAQFRDLLAGVLKCAGCDVDTSPGTHLTAGNFNDVILRANHSTRGRLEYVVAKGKVGARRRNGTPVPNGGTS
jgi:predicted nucleotide-binding protein